MAHKQNPQSDSEIAFIKEQTRVLAADLAFYARGPVRLHLIGGDQYGYTYDAGGEGSVINIHLNPSVLIEIRNRERAVNVWRGLGFHELAHHLWPAHEQYKKAAEEGFKDLFNLIDDEQNERRGRSKDPSWGSAFQTLVAWVIRKDKASRWNEVTGEKSEITDEKTAAGYIARFNEFLYHFRRHLPGPKDPVVAEALAMIPADLKDLSKDELLDLTRDVQKVLARGVEVPEPAAPAPAEEEKKPEKKPEPEPEGEEKPGGIPVDIPLWRQMFKSQWFYAMLAVFVAGWFFFFTRKGLGGWDSAFWITAGATIAAVLLLALAMWLESMREKMTTKVGRVKLKPSRLEVLGEVVKGGWRKTWGALKSAAGGLADRFDSLLEKVIPKPVAAFFDFVVSRIISPVWNALKTVWHWLVVAAVGTWHGLVWLWRQTRRLALKIWRSQIFRALLVAAPLAAVLAMILAVIVKTNWLALIVLLIILLLLALLSWLFRKKITKFVMPPPPPMDGPLPASGDVNDEEMLEFSVIHNIVPIEADQASLDALLPDVLPLATQMRRYLEQTGLASVDLEDQETGHELVDDIERAALGETGLCVDEHKIAKASVHIEVGIDCSLSMAGDKVELAKRFGLLIEEAVRAVRGITAHFWGFTDRAIYDCGVPGQMRISGLYASGGNNDAAMLWHMYKSAATSGKELRILLMVSDGEPTECTWGSLDNLVCRLEMAGFVPVQIAVDKINNPAFKTYFVDLVGQPMASAIIDFGRMLLTLVEAHR